jgi:hypothetical protein
VWWKSMRLIQLGKITLTLEINQIARSHELLPGTRVSRSAIARNAVERELGCSEESLPPRNMIESDGCRP